MKKTNLKWNKEDELNCGIFCDFTLKKQKLKRIAVKKKLQTFGKVKKDWVAVRDLKRREIVI